MKKIVRGNDFTLRIPVKKIVNGEQVAFPLPACTDIVVNIVNQYRRVNLAYSIDTAEDNIINARVEGDAVSVGTYALEIRGKIFGNDWRSKEYEQFAIVDNNASGDTAFNGELIEGEDSVEMNTALVILPPTAELTQLITDANTAVETAKQTDATLKANESERMEAEQQRASAEVSRVSAENKRSESEKARHAAETERMSNEDARKTAEVQRANAETERAEAEKTRTANETARVAVEKQRATAFTELSANVDAAVSKANTAASAANTATDKANAEEDKRAEAEIQRAEAEAARKQNENMRQEAETERVRQEAARETAEATRQNAEAEREKADAEREKRVSEAISNASSAAKAATDAAAMATEAGNNADIKAAEAERVNAELNGNVLTVTNRQGTAKSVNLTDADEHVTVNVTTTLASVSVEGIILNVYINNGADPQQYTTDGNGQAVFTVTKGSTYKVVFPYINGCAILNPVQHVAAVGNRIIDAVYVEETIKFEHVTVRMQKANEDDVLQPWEGAPVHVTIDGKKTDYITDAQGMASFDVKIGTSYTVVVDKVDGMYEQYDNYSRKRTAIADSYRFNYAYHYYESGVWLVDDEGKKWTWDAWEASRKDKTHLVFVCIKTLDTQRYGGDIYISIDLLANFAQIPSRQWSNPIAQFKNIPLNGTAQTDSQYYKFAYNGLASTKAIIAEGDERSIETPFCDYCYSKTVDCAGETWQGYSPTLGQWELAWANIDFVIDAINLKFPELGASVNNYRGNKWTASQNNVNNSFYFHINAAPSNKNTMLLAVPFFACPSPSLSLSLSSEEGASVDAERVV
jgi:hypothetical protein